MMREEPLFYQWVNLGSAFIYIYRFLICIAGTVFFFYTGREFLDKPLFNLNLIGEKTLGIYAFQFVAIHYVMMWLNYQSDKFLMILLATVFSTVISVIVVIMIEKIPYIRLLLIEKQ